VFADGLIPEYAFERYLYLYKSETVLFRIAIAERAHWKVARFQVSKFDSQVDGKER